eukprot:scaffold3939_cov166-Amphora_coffeaeformis.AAC.7
MPQGTGQDRSSPSGTRHVEWNASLIEAILEMTWKSVFDGDVFRFRDELFMGRKEHCPPHSSRSPFSLAPFGLLKNENLYRQGSRQTVKRPTNKRVLSTNRSSWYPLVSFASIPGRVSWIRNAVVCVRVEPGITFFLCSRLFHSRASVWVRNTATIISLSVRVEARIQ